ncbi:MAG: hypothetical protein CMJ77_15975 [Planctomycetaceae bacterium]|nr:hypothetical protein [Planctomycetaceae bacterium]
MIAIKQAGTKEQVRGYAFVRCTRQVESTILGKELQDWLLDRSGQEQPKRRTTFEPKKLSE